MFFLTTKQHIHHNYGKSPFFIGKLWKITIRLGVPIFKAQFLVHESSKNNPWPRGLERQGRTILAYCLLSKPAKKRAQFCDRKIAENDLTGLELSRYIIVNHSKSYNTDIWMMEWWNFTVDACFGGRIFDPPPCKPQRSLRKTPQSSEECFNTAMEAHLANLDPNMRITTSVVSAPGLNWWWW